MMATQKDAALEITPATWSSGILSAIGKTPMVRLPRISRRLGFNLYAKLEFLNPAGSIKDRPALEMIRRAIEMGLVTSRTTVIESSSGNLALGLAQACAAIGIRFLCVLDPKVTPQNVRLLKLYNAEVDVVSKPDPTSGLFQPARINRVKYLLGAIPDSFWPNQYGNIANSFSHHQTMREIADSLDGRVDYLFCAVSTCGTLRGCCEFKRIHNLLMEIVAVDALGSVLFGDTKCDRMIPGHGAAVVPDLFAPSLSDRHIQISDRDCVLGCYRLLRSEAILAGGSSGAVMAAIEKSAAGMKRGSNCVGILCDRGERYMDTIYSAEWLNCHFGEINSTCNDDFDSRISVS